MKKRGCSSVPVAGSTRHDGDSALLSGVIEAIGSLGEDLLRNLQHLVAAAGELLGADAAVYSRISSGKLWRDCRWRVAETVPVEDKAPGRICFETIISEWMGGTKVVRHLAGTDYSILDPLVKSAGFQSYVGHPVVRNGEVIGALAVLFHGDVAPDEGCLRILDMLAHLIGREEASRRSRRDVLREEARLGAFFRSSADAILIHDFSGQIIEANQSAERMFGFRKGWLLRMKVPGLIPPESAVVAKAALRELRRTGYCRMEFELRRVDGSRFPAEIVASRFDIEGAAHVQVMARDLSARRRVEKEVLNRELRFRLVFEESIDGIILHDGGGRILEANRSACRMTGYTREELIGVNMSGLVGCGSEPGLAKAMLAEEPSDFHEVTIVRKDGSAFPAEVATSRVMLEGEMLVQQIIRDVTMRREAEAEIRRSKEEAERANEAKTLFLATMSHEIRTPLNGILGFARLLKDERLDERQREYVAIIERSGDILLSLISDILDFSRIESGILELESRAFDVGRMVRETVILLEPEARAKGMVLQTTIGGGVPERIMGDSARFRQVLMNLVGNAVKFTLRGQVSVNLEAAEGRLEISVRDTGPGFSEEQRAHLFEPFYQTDLSSTRTHGGTGLGLSICKRLVTAMGGGIDGIATGRGAIFTFWVPYVEAKEGAVAVVPRRPCPLVARHGCRILVAEDQPINARLMSLMLGKLGIQADIVADGLKAIDYLKAAPEVPDAVLLDMRMPGLDGVEVAKRIRAGMVGEAAVLLPLVAVTGNASEDDRKACLSAGMDHYLSKPVKPESLEGVLERIGLLEVAR
ncbi:PAS domain S-box protein [Luteolibacter sp. LG18]|uniref:PAS domain S-box protein n=1 Tax=Luteolibacter sp. LG18 TaxID=2819286 RepID=UPI0030C72925